jgi:hypothetical protein
MSMAYCTQDLTSCARCKVYGGNKKKAPNANNFKGKALIHKSSIRMVLKTASKGRKYEGYGWKEGNFHGEDT